jgi:hypothetical protein
MSLDEPFVEARRRLGLSPDDNLAAVKRAYRRAVALAPPDREPEQFRKVRDAYELLTDPVERARKMLLSPVPFVPPPKLPSLEAGPGSGPGSLALELLRAIVARLPVEELVSRASGSPTAGRAAEEPDP